LPLLWHKCSRSRPRPPVRGDAAHRGLARCDSPRRPGRSDCGAQGASSAAGIESAVLALSQAGVASKVISGVEPDGALARPDRMEVSMRAIRYVLAVAATALSFL